MWTLFVGRVFSKPDLIIWIEQGRMLLIRDQGPLEKRMACSPSTDEQWDLQGTGKLLYFGEYDGFRVITDFIFLNLDGQLDIVNKKHYFDGEC